MKCVFILVTAILLCGCGPGGDSQAKLFGGWLPVCSTNVGRSVVAVYKTIYTEDLDAKNEKYLASNGFVVLPSGVSIDSQLVVGLMGTYLVSANKEIERALQDSSVSGTEMVKDFLLRGGKVFTKNILRKDGTIRNTIRVAVVQAADGKTVYAFIYDIAD